MSFAAFLELPDVKERFRSEFPIPGRRIEREILAPPVSGRQALVDAAFNCLLRLYVRRLNRGAVPCPRSAGYALWTAFDALGALWGSETVDVIGKQGRRTLTKYREIYRLAQRASRIVEEAMGLYRAYLRTGKLTDELVAHMVRLAHLESFHRGGGGTIGDFNDVSQEDVEDLRQLISVARANKHLFKATGVCLPNPSFGLASIMVGGARADILVDGTLIEVTATTGPEVDPDLVRRLIGYYVLSRVGGIDGLGRAGPVEVVKLERLMEPRITRLGVYFARFGHMEVWDVDEIVDHERFFEFVKWFCNKAKEVNPGRGYSSLRYILEEDLRRRRRLYRRQKAKMSATGPQGSDSGGGL